MTTTIILTSCFLCVCAYFLFKKRNKKTKQIFQQKNDYVMFEEDTSFGSEHKESFLHIPLENFANYAVRYFDSLQDTEEFLDYLKKLYFSLYRLSDKANFLTKYAIYYSLFEDHMRYREAIYDLEYQKWEDLHDRALGFYITHVPAFIKNREITLHEECYSVSFFIENKPVILFMPYFLWDKYMKKKESKSLIDDKTRELSRSVCVN